MDQIALYKGFRIRACEEWSGIWLAEAKKPFDTDAEYIATPSGHPTPEAAIDFIKQMIDGRVRRDKPHKLCRRSPPWLAAYRSGR
jgi:hypothetical protein